MKQALARCLGLVVLTLITNTLSAQTVNFTTTYRGGSTSSCNTSTFTIRGVEPSVPGRYPVFLYMVGTSERFDNASALSAIREMGGRGYVAATIQYASSSFGNCTSLSAKARCIFNPASATSAVSALCSRAKADCSKGIAVAGFSQGAIMAILARNFDSRVRAAYGLGAGVQYSVVDLRSCVADGRRLLSSSRLRAVNGEADDFMGRSASLVRSQLQQLTGLTCTPASTSCFRTNSSGWYMVSRFETNHGTADHCYMRASGCAGSQNSLDSAFLSTFLWSLDTNLIWLTQFTEH